ncbi:hypothetical protein TWF696_004391 [Orbilia brochopaga]|uniref:Carrier domain-containing protein n=1 Tax=Orbilia brochopaga TaxID=3140254 RepID=A0AAV9V776_9PEZI
MILVDLSYDDAAKELNERRSSITVAIHSSPSTCVLSGSVDAVNDVTQYLEGKGIRVRRVATDVAFHSPALDELVVPLRTLLTGNIKPMEPHIPLYSTSLADPRGRNPRGESYWIDNMVKPVLLTSAVKAALEDGFKVFLEVSSHPIVSHSITETIIDTGADDVVVFPTLRRNKPTKKSILLALGKLYCSGSALNFRDAFPGAWSRDVPATSWKHKPFWRKVETGPLQMRTTYDPNTHSLLGAKDHVVGSETTIWSTVLDGATRPFPGSHPLHGTEIVPAAVLLNTFLHTSTSNSLKNVILRVPVALNALRKLQVVKDRNRIRLCSRLQNTEDNENGDNSANSSWLTHTTSYVASGKCSTKQFDIASTKQKLKTTLKPSFATEYLASVGVPDMGFPWKVIEHFGDRDEMLSKVDTAPGIADGSLPWAKTSWAPALDAATSIASSIFYKEPVLRTPAQIDEVIVASGFPIPKTVYIHTTVAHGPWTVNVSVLNEQGQEVACFKSMRFSAVEGTPGVSGSMESLVHQISWVPAKLEEEAFHLRHVVFLSERTDRLVTYSRELRRRKISATVISNAAEISLETLPEGTIIAYIPCATDEGGQTLEQSSRFCETLLDIAKALINEQTTIKLWCITDGLFQAQNLALLSQAPLIGLSRVIASEHPEIWGGLVDTDDESFPLQAIKYVKSADAISVRDSVARLACLRPIPRAKIVPGRTERFVPKADGTYLITGGLGALGLEIAKWMVERGARRLVLVSRRRFPPRHKWGDDQQKDNAIIPTIQKLETDGASIHIVAADTSLPEGVKTLERALELLDLPRITGVVHAAGILEDQLVTETTRESFERVLAPKISGAMALHELFPPKTLEFMVLSSSCGQLLGFTGQASYASGNSFLDAFADFRRNHGDNIISFLWTSFNGLGMASSTGYINAELEAKGITSITRDEGFEAWEHATNFDINQAVVLRALPVDENGILAHPILNEIAPRRRAITVANDEPNKNQAPTPNLVKGAPDLKKQLQDVISECVAKTLRLPSAGEVDPSTALTEMGMDSVMTVSLRMHLQNSLKVKVPPTLIWGHPTVNHLVKWFEDKI